MVNAMNLQNKRALGDGTPHYGETFPRERFMVNDGTRNNAAEIENTRDV
jgi:hypothetical protein